MFVKTTMESKAYKNYKAFINLCFDEQNHSLKTELHFFLQNTMVKSPYDLIRRTVKCLVANASLKIQHDECILTPMQLYEWAAENVKVIHFFYISSENANASCIKFCLDKCYSFGSMLDETGSQHSFIPVSLNSGAMWRTSFDDIFSYVTFCHNNTGTSMLQPGRYIAYLYEYKWYIAIIMDRCDENNVKAKFMRHNRLFYVFLAMIMTINVGFHFNISSVLLKVLEVVGNTF